MAIKKIKLLHCSIVLSLIVLAAVLRLWNLGNYPPLNADEAAIGYNAWSILQTGRDEHGEFFPIHFKSFGDYKPGLYFYIVIPFVKLLGLNEWAVRLPSALAGIGTVYIVYLLAKLLWQDEVLGLVWAAILAILPWHIHFSRGGWESNVAVFLTTLGVYLFYKLKVKLKVQGFLLVLLPFILATYTYHSARIIAPILFLGLIVFNWKLVRKNLKSFVFASLIGFVLMLPLTVSFLKGGASSRFSGVGIFADQGPLWRVNELINQHERDSLFFVRAFHNKVVIYGISFFQKYFSHFDGDFLFISGDTVPRSKLPEMGVMYLIDAPLLMLGVWFWLRTKKEYQYLPFLWLVIAPLASALTFQAPSALRALSMTIPLTFFVGYGVSTLLKFEIQNSKIKTIIKNIKLLIFFLIILSYGWGGFYWKDAYFNHYLKRYPDAWPDFKLIVEKLEIAGESVCVETNVDQPYILALFYLKYPPERIQKEIKLTPPDQFGFSTVRSFGKYQFGDCGRFDGKIIQVKSEK